MIDLSSRVIACGMTVCVIFLATERAAGQPAAPARPADVAVGAASRPMDAIIADGAGSLGLDALDGCWPWRATLIQIGPFASTWAFWPRAIVTVPSYRLGSIGEVQRYDEAAERAWEDLKERMSRVVPQYRAELMAIAGRAQSPELSARQAALDYHRSRQIRKDTGAFIKGSTVGIFRFIHRPDLFELRREAQRLGEVSKTAEPILFARATNDRLLKEGLRLAGDVDVLIRQYRDVESFWERLPEGRAPVRAIVEKTRSLDPTRKTRLAAEVPRVLRELQDLVVALRPLDLVTPPLEESVAGLEDRLPIVRALPPTPEWYDGVKLLEEGGWNEVVVIDQDRSGTVDINADTPRLVRLSTVPAVDLEKVKKAGPPDSRADERTDGVMLSAGVPLKVFLRSPPRLSGDDSEYDRAFVSRGPYYVTHLAGDRATIRPNPNLKEDPKKPGRNPQRSVARDELIFWTG